MSWDSKKRKKPTEAIGRYVGIDLGEHAPGASLIADSSGPNVLHKLFHRSQAAHRDWFRAEAELLRRQTERLSRLAPPADPPAGPPTARNEPNHTPIPEPDPAPRARGTRSLCGSATQPRPMAHGPWPPGPRERSEPFSRDFRPAPATIHPMRYIFLALSLAATATAVTPSYSAAGIVNAANGAPGPFAPNAILSLYGSGLALASQALTPDDIQGGSLPTALGYTQVFVDNYPVPLFYVSDGQINFLVPSNQSTGNATVRVAMQGNSGPVVTVTIADAAPALFSTPSGYAIATHADNSLITPDAPAHAGEIVVVYCTGLGKTQPNPDTGEIAPSAAQIVALASLTVSLGGNPLDADLIKYAGLTPGSAGLYQINLALPASPGTDPEIRLAIAGQTTPPGLKLACQ